MLPFFFKFCKIENMEIDFQQYVGNTDLKAIINYSLSKFKCKSEIQGLSHWRRVARNGLVIARHAEEVNKRVVVLFGFLHDHMRQSDGNEHGPKAAMLLHQERITTE